ncbi:MAG: glycoside hydrolase family 127 protein [Lachnospiraceae bacterium]|nr:glycoside hydrolase family 127 protein [Lachnospiraceae bacterium]
MEPIYSSSEHKISIPPEPVQVKISVPPEPDQVKITDVFWAEKMRLVREVVIPYQWELLNDRVPEAEPSYCMHNFKAAARLQEKKRKEGRAYKAPVYSFRGFQALPEDPRRPEEDQFYGFVFQDTDFSKWIEAVGYTLSQHPDPELERTADEAIDIVCRAQEENGYLDTYYILNGMDKAFTNLRDHHELYCLGHLVEGAVSYYKATGKDRLLKAACRFADHVYARFGKEEGKFHGYPGHEIAEMALFKLYELTGKEAYKDLACYFINERGTKPYYFEQEHPEENAFDGTKDEYHQAHLPVREQKEAVGHAVRAVYLYSGMADMARITGDETLCRACRTLWNSITEEKLYITGGIGGTHVGEAFSYPYDLPNDTAYAETCASVGLVFFARRMLQMDPDSRYADVMELALYNTVLAGMAQDGKSFFYVNPLEAEPEACRRDARKSYVEPVRQKWFGCACCPPNIARLISSLGSYVCTASEDTLYVHLFLSGTVSVKAGDGDAVLDVDSDLLKTGRVSFRVRKPENTPYTIAVRIPGWCRDSYRLEGLGDWAGDYYEKGYLYLPLAAEETSFDMIFDISPVYVEASGKVREDEGKLAVMRGPVVYCSEEADNGKDLHLLRFVPENRPEEVSESWFGVQLGSRKEALSGEQSGSRTEAPAEGGTEALAEAGTKELPGALSGNGMVFLKVQGKRVKKQGKAFLASGLYHVYEPPAEEEAEIRLIPYHLWANRGEGEMTVYLRAAEN